MDTQQPFHEQYYAVPAGGVLHLLGAGLARAGLTVARATIAVLGQVLGRG